jgi:hypothetical protein
LEQRIKRNEEEYNNKYKKMINEPFDETTSEELKKLQQDINKDK